MDNQQTVASSPKYWRLVELAAAVIFVASIGTIIALLHNPEWHVHLLRLIGRAFDVFVTQDVGSTGRGFLNFGLEAVLGAAGMAIMTGLFLGAKAPRKDRVETAIITLVSFATVALVLYGTQFAWEVAKVGYQDHSSLVTKVNSMKNAETLMVDPSGRDTTIKDLQNKLKESQSQLAIRKQMMVIGDPSFDNMRKILEAFRGYRGLAKGQRCFVYLTSPSQSAIVTIMSELSNSVSDCFTSSSTGEGNVDAEGEVKDGMMQGVIVIHAPKGDPGANRVEEILSGTLPLKRSYKPFPPSISHYQNQTAGDPVLWLQFGPDVRWNSDHTAKGKP